MAIPSPALEFVNVSKRFGAVEALRDVSFTAAAGAVHALLGENGAGKSTLLRVLSGAHRPSVGWLRIRGADRLFRAPAEALAAGVAVIYQELHLASQLSVAENVYLGRLPARAGWVARARLNEMTRQQLARLRTDIDPRARVGDLSIAQRQLVEIAKALARGADILAFDEPTSSLSSQETEALFSVIREMRTSGCTVIYVSHRLDEVFQVCDTATVLRDGRRVASFAQLDGVRHGDLVRAMVGRDIADIYAYRARAPGRPRLEVDRIRGPGVRDPVSLTVRGGEIVGLFGLVGAGRTELLRLIFGAQRADAGAIRIDGHAHRIRAPRDAIRAGVALCPEDRKREGIIPLLSVAENLSLSARRLTARGGWINRVQERADADAQIRRLGVRARSPSQRLQDLSGGNQQKVVLGRWLTCNVGVLLLDEPTRGVDVGAKSELYTILYELAADGVAILLASSELPEILGVCDRVLVMRAGGLSGSLARHEATEEALMHLALPGDSAARRSTDDRP